MVVGAPAEQASARGINGNQSDNGAPYSGAAYVFVRSGTNWVQQAYFKASNAEAWNLFGYSVAVSGDTVVVGAVGERSNATGVNGDQNNNSIPEAGAAYVFVRSGTNWTQQAYLKASNTGGATPEGELHDQFGASVAVSGETVVVGAPYESSNAAGVNGDQNDNSAFAAGAAYVFVRTGTNWTQQVYLKASNPGREDRFGESVGISGDSVVIGAPGEASNATGVNGAQSNNSAPLSGAAYVFVRGGTNWSQQAYLKASNAQPESFFGFSVAVSGDTIVVGGPTESSSATGVNGDQTDQSWPGAGAAYVFVRSDTNWSQQAYLKASRRTGLWNRFGVPVAVSEDTVVVGAFFESSAGIGVNSGQDDGFLPVLAENSGAAHVFVRSWTNWTHQVYLKASNAESYDTFGHSVAVSGGVVVVGAKGEDSIATGANGDQTNNNALDSGAAYVFANVCSVCPRLMLTRDGSGGYFIRFNGAPGVPYQLQRAPGFAGPWTTITTLAPPPSGHFEYRDMPPPGQAFYRTVQP